MTKKKRDDAVAPGVGAVVWYRTEWSHPDHKDEGPHDTDQPLAATVAHVWSDHSVNLSVIAADGHSYGVQAVPMVYAGDDPPEDGHYCEWPS